MCSETRTHGADSTPSRGPWIILSILVVAAFLGLLAHGDLPLVRNSALYARITHALIERGTEFTSWKHGYNKALGFPVLSLPAVAIFGASFGLKLSSFLWTSLWLAALIPLFGRLGRMVERNSARRFSVALAVTVTALNPLVFHQFTSAYADALHCLFFVTALIFLDRMLSSRARRFDSSLFTLSMLLAIWAKHHGFVLFGILPIFAVCRWRLLIHWWRDSRRRIWTTVAPLAPLIVVILLAQRGRVPLFNLSNNTSNYGGSFGKLAAVLGPNLLNATVFFLLSFTVLLPFLFRWRRFRARLEWYLTILFFAATVIVYRGFHMNIRYFLPIAPLFAWIIVENLTLAGPRLRRAASVLFVLVGTLLTLAYNDPTVHRVVNEIVEVPRIENLRLTRWQIPTQRRIDLINRSVTPERNVLYFANSYYGTGLWNVWEREGLFSPDLTIVYMREPVWDEILADANAREIEQAILFTRYELEDAGPAGVRLDRLGERVYSIAFTR